MAKIRSEQEGVEERGDDEQRVTRNWQRRSRTRRNKAIEQGKGIKNNPLKNTKKMQKNAKKFI